jgi:hypothetical protein
VGARTGGGTTSTDRTATLATRVWAGLGGYAHYLLIAHRLPTYHSQTTYLSLTNYLLITHRLPTYHSHPCSVSH